MLRENWSTFVPSRLVLLELYQAGPATCGELCARLNLLLPDTDIDRNMANNIIQRGRREGRIRHKGEGVRRKINGQWHDKKYVLTPLGRQCAERDLRRIMAVARHYGRLQIRAVLRTAVDTIWEI